MALVGPSVVVPELVLAAGMEVHPMEEPMEEQTMDLRFPTDLLLELVSQAVLAGEPVVVAALAEALLATPLVPLVSLQVQEGQSTHCSSSLRFQKTQDFLCKCENLSFVPQKGYQVLLQVVTALGAVTLP